MSVLIVASVFALYLYACKALVFHLQLLVGHKVNTHTLITFSIFWPVMFIATVVIVSVALMCMAIKEVCEIPFKKGA